MSDTKTKRLNQIFDATLRLTGEVGIAGLKMSNIAQEASIATGTLYIYFENKEELLNALYFKLQKESVPAIINDISHLAINIQLYKMWKIALERLVDNNLRIIFLEQFVISPYISESNKQIDIGFKNYLKQILEQGKSENLIKDANSDMLITLIIGFVRSFSTQIVNDCSGQLTEKSIDESFSICWDAIKK
ncbi:TetR/AcrR family transcriptional regulator [Flagellimonas hymeniacidonis]|uniref:TetR/AcrR family transcriptional regulator n=1 Tax=Flagellimonas hymeniacidonis TaxID=2603628 RepID=A0A5C8VBY9_9FLAO|nr:TetR/AcrR family transcriptional regulator [Flagellimonas hymeniacidonis]TXN38318.1 TetR/AcrR family transcriptional regulator [Flagellimonas hymeniacidonis]